MADPILLQMKYARIVEEFGKIANISWETALDFFYHDECVSAEEAFEKLLQEIDPGEK